MSNMVEPAMPGEILAAEAELNDGSLAARRSRKGETIVGGVDADDDGGDGDEEGDAAVLDSTADLGGDEGRVLPRERFEIGRLVEPVIEKPTER